MVGLERDKKRIEKDINKSLELAQTGVYGTVKWPGFSTEYHLHRCMLGNWI